MSVVTTIPKARAKAFARKLTDTLSGNHDTKTVDMIDNLNRQLAGWAAFYKFTDFSAYVFQRIDTVVWKRSGFDGRLSLTRPALAVPGFDSTLSRILPGSYSQVLSATASG